MYVKPNSTRHTAIGTLRFGVVYKLDATDLRVETVVAALSGGDNPVLEKLTEDQVKDLNSDVVSLESTSEVETVKFDDGSQVENEQLRKDLEQSTLELKASQDIAADMKQRLTGAEKELSETQDLLKAADAERLQAVSDLDAANAAHLAEIQTLTADLAKVPSEAKAAVEKPQVKPS